jgi:protein gp37
MRFAANRLDGNPKTPQYEGTTEKVNGNPVWTGKVTLASEKTLVKPLSWREPRSIFVNSMGDLFHEDVPDEWIDQVFATMMCAQSSNHIFIILTKRAQRMHDYINELKTSGRWLIFKHPKWGGYIFDASLAKYEAMASRIWLGVSTEDQATANERIPFLMETPSAVRFVSCEPLLAELDIQRWLKVRWQCSGCRGYFNGPYQKECPDCGRDNYWSGSHKFNGRKTPHLGLCPSQSGIAIDWVIAGGESGPNARAMHPDWARSLRDQCQAANVPFFFKQWGEFVTGYIDGDEYEIDEECHGPVQGNGFAEWHTNYDMDPLHYIRIGKKKAGHLLDGVKHFNWPECVKTLEEVE